MAMGTGKKQVNYHSAMVIAENLQKKIAPYCVPDRCVIAGSLRRKKKRVGDIEIVCIPTFETTKKVRVDNQRDMFSKPKCKVFKTNSVVGHIERDGICDTSDSRDYTIIKGGNRYHQVLYCGMQCDIFMTNRKQWGRMLAIRTGPAGYSIKLASRCNELGYKGHNGELVSLDGNRTKPSFPTEKSFYEFLGWDYPEPENRG